MSIDLSKYQKDSTLIWAVQNIRLPKGAPWDFSDRQWQLQLMDDQSKQIVVRKPTQVGLSTVMLTKMLHFADLHRCRAIMTLPRQDDVYDLVNSRLSEIIENSPYILERMVGVDNVRMKRFGESWLHFVEMSVPPRMMDVDWMLNDEVDLSNSEYLEQAVSRMDASQYGYHHRISTPTIPGYGIDALYELSDKKVWIVKCPYCSFEQDLDWNLNVANEGGKTWYKCTRCGNKLHEEDIREGRWIVTGDSNSAISGYQINQMMCTYIDPSKLWVQYKTLTTKNFYNFRLGLPYAASSGGVSRDVLMERCFQSAHSKEVENDGESVYVLGADQGNTIHVSVAKIEGNTAKIVFLEEIPFDAGFKRLEDIIRKFKIKYAVIDALPNHHSSRQLAESLKGVAYTAYFTALDKLYASNDQTLKININKTDAYDHLLYKISSYELQFYGFASNIDVALNKAMSHISNMRRDIEQQNTRAGGVKTFHVWKGVGADHYADAIVYMLIAADMAHGVKSDLKIYDIGDILNSMIAEEDDGVSGLMVDPALMRENSGKSPSLRSVGDDVEFIPLEELGFPPDNPYASYRSGIMEILFGNRRNENGVD